MILLASNTFLLLQVTVELASDSKDFTTVLAKMQLAEAGSVKMVSIPQQPKPKSQPVVIAEPATSASVRTGLLSTSLSQYILTWFLWIIYRKFATHVS